MAQTTAGKIVERHATRDRHQMRHLCCHDPVLHINCQWYISAADTRVLLLNYGLFLLLSSGSKATPLFASLSQMPRCVRHPLLLRHERCIRTLFHLLPYLMGRRLHLQCTLFFLSSRPDVPIRGSRAFACPPRLSLSPSPDLHCPHTQREWTDSRTQRGPAKRSPRSTLKITLGYDMK